MNELIGGNNPEYDDEVDQMPGMAKLKEIETKINSKQDLSREELRFLHEIGSTFEGTDMYERDDKVIELRKTRDYEADMPVVFDCEPQQIARTIEQIDENTKAFVGKLESGIFEKIQLFPNIEHFFSEFPEGRIKLSKLTIGGKKVDELESTMKGKGVDLNKGTISMLHDKNFRTSEQPEEISLVRLRLTDIGLIYHELDMYKLQEINSRAAEFGLKLCPPEVGPYQRLADMDQPIGDYYSIAMEPLTDIQGLGWQSIFHIGHSNGSIFLFPSLVSASLEREWDWSESFVFQLPEVSKES